MTSHDAMNRILRRQPASQPQPPADQPPQPTSINAGEGRVQPGSRHEPEDMNSALRDYAERRRLNFPRRERQLWRGRDDDAA